MACSNHLSLWYELAGWSPFDLNHLKIVVHLEQKIKTDMQKKRLDNNNILVLKCGGLRHGYLALFKVIQASAEELTPMQQVL